MQEEKILQFWQKYGYYDVSSDNLRWAIKKHLEYKTIETVEVNNEIVAFARWNIDGLNALILDCVIKPEYRNKNLIRLIALKGFRRFPFVQTIQFQRGLRNEKTRKINIIRFLGLKNV